MDAEETDTPPFPALRPIEVIELGTSVAVAGAGRILRQLGLTVYRLQHDELDPAIASYYQRRKLSLSDRIETEHDHRTIVLADAASSASTLPAELTDDVVVRVTPLGEAAIDLQPADEISVAALAGLAHLTPRDIPLIDEQSQPPLAMPGRLVSNYAAIATAVAALAAVYSEADRRVDVDVSMLEVILPTLRREIAYYAYDGSVASRFMRVWRLAPWGVRPSRDGYFFVQVVEEHHWRGLVEMMGSPEWALDADLLDPIIRFERRAEVDAKVAEWIATVTNDDLVRMTTERNLPFAPVNYPRDLIRMPQIVHRGFVDRSAGDVDLSLPFHVRRSAA